MGQLVIPYIEIAFESDPGSYVMEKLQSVGAPVIKGESQIYLDPAYQWDTSNCTETETLTITWSNKNAQLH